MTTIAVVRKNGYAAIAARLAIGAAADFDDGTGLPLTSHAVKLKVR
jgi:hypothetical protein